MKFEFRPVSRAPSYNDVTPEKWNSWVWQLQNSLSTLEDFSKHFALMPEEKWAFENGGSVFKVATTPYYASLALQVGEMTAASVMDWHQRSHNPIRRIFMPSKTEHGQLGQQMIDPLAEEVHSANPNLIHRYSDRVLFLVTDTCSVYCRFCTRKRFTGHDSGFVGTRNYLSALDYIKEHPGIREVILSGGDPLTLSNSMLERVLRDIRSIDHVEIIRIGTRMPVVCPMRVDEPLAAIIRKYGPVYMMTHFSHPKELTTEATLALGLLADHGIPLFNQMVLLNGVNNHASIVQALNRRLLYLRVKPYYMFQCDPSQGTDHLRTSVESSEAIVRELWGHLSGLASASLSLDIPNGGGKTSLVPNFEVSREAGVRHYVGWDGRVGEYQNPAGPEELPCDVSDYQSEWEQLKNAKSTIEVPQDVRISQ
ncbi:MAG: KamA family radical SAM protein [Oligoflexia bacterium]|nr:KamA family radical SAM protein [Oligoflexia bacterium]